MRVPSSIRWIRNIFNRIFLAVYLCLSVLSQAAVFIVKMYKIFLLLDILDLDDVRPFLISCIIGCSILLAFIDLYTVYFEVSAFENGLRFWLSSIFRLRWHTFSVIDWYVQYLMTVQHIYSKLLVILDAWRMSHLNFTTRERAMININNNKRHTSSSHSEFMFRFKYSWIFFAAAAAPNAIFIDAWIRLNRSIYI